jgi:hypothetical protein
MAEGVNVPAAAHRATIDEQRRTFAVACQLSKGAHPAKNGAARDQACLRTTRRRSMRLVRSVIAIGLAIAGAGWVAGPAAAQGSSEACAAITRACVAAGFSQGAAAQGLGLKNDCVDPIVQGAGQPPRAARPLPAVSPQTVAACRGTAPAGPQGATNPAPAPASGGPRFSPADAGQSVHDNDLHVTWLADADLPAKLKYNLPINVDGSMDYATAQAWITALNTHHYLGHNTWTLPSTQRNDPACNTRGPQNNRFGYGCRNTDMGSLFYNADALHLTQFETAVPMPPSTFKAFMNLQPYLYWTGTPATPGQPQKSGMVTFSFATGWTGSNVSQHVMYVLPMLPGNPFGAPSPRDKSLQVTAGGQAVYDPATDITWLADANFAAERVVTASGVDADGSMPASAVTGFLYAMNHYQGAGYLGKNGWRLPDAAVPGGSPCGNFGCSASPLGELFYQQFKLSKGETAVTTPDVAVGPFHDIQPYLYWSCEGDPGQTACNGGAPAPNFSWSFSFGNGFEGTDLVQNYLFVTAYYPDYKPPPPPIPPHPCGLRCN